MTRFLAKTITWIPHLIHLPSILALILEITGALLIYGIIVFLLGALRREEIRWIFSLFVFSKEKKQPPLS
jgi:hypothetical protein